MTGLDSLDAQGYRQHGLAGTGRTKQEQIVAALEEAQSRQFAHQLAIDRGLETEIELLEGLDLRKARQAQAPFHPFEAPALPLGAERLAQKLPVIEFAFGRLLTYRVELGGQMIELESDAQLAQLHHSTSS
jgi:hypothetical protein